MVRRRQVPRTLGNDIPPSAGQPLARQSFLPSIAKAYMSLPVSCFACCTSMANLASVHDLLTLTCNPSISLPHTSSVPPSLPAMSSVYPVRWTTISQKIDLSIIAFPVTNWLLGVLHITTCSFLGLRFKLFLLLTRLGSVSASSFPARGLKGVLPLPMLQGFWLLSQCFWESLFSQSGVRP